MSPKRFIRFSWYREHVSLLIVTLGAVVALGGVFAGILDVYQTSENTHKAVCALRAERIRGVQSSLRFLHEHPDGIPGISRADILRSIDTQRETVRAFRFADC